jgi:L,D-transpeptidase catalytic domain/Bacterial SH3 domain
MTSVKHTSAVGWRVALCLLALGLSVSPGAALADRWASEPGPPQVWVATTALSYLRDEPDANAQPVTMVRAGTPLRILADEDGWKRVFDPHTGTTAYVNNELLQHITQPSPFAYKPGPRLDQELATEAVAPTDLPLYFYPDPDPRAQALVVQASKREAIVGSVIGDDGEQWLVTDDGYYLPRTGLFVADAPEEFGGRWLDVSLTGAAKVVAYEGGEPVRQFFAIKGVAKFPTPLGAWSIVRRVADETMDSTTIGIPRNSPGGYFLQHVLYTQYFRDTGESLHYNWWSSAWGTSGSHGCLGLSLGDSKWLWDWATIGTPVYIHS